MYNSVLKTTNITVINNNDLNTVFSNLGEYCLINNGMQLTPITITMNIRMNIINQWYS